MKKIPTTAKILLVLCLLGFAHTGAHAFEINGLHSGMPQDEALQILRSRVDSVVAMQGSPDYNPTFLATRSESGMSEALTFCRGHLHSYQYDVTGGFRAFTRLVDKETLKRGTGRYEVTARETSAGEWNSIKVYWLSGQEIFEIGYSVISGEQAYSRYVVSTPCK